MAISVSTLWVQPRGRKRVARKVKIDSSEQRKIYQFLKN